MARRKQAAHGGHGWFVTFADLMGLLVSFFVMLVAFSNQDTQKMRIVTGSMREAFGVQKEFSYSGVVESDGLPNRPKLKNAAHIAPEDSSVTPTPDQQSNGFHKDETFAMAVASLRQALRDMPELAEASKHIMVEESKEGFNIQLMDQDGRSMFPEGSTEPYDRTRVIVEKLAGPLKGAPYRIAIVGHTAAAYDSSPDRQWQLSVGRANAVRQILEEEGYPSSNIYKVSGKAANDPLVADDPSVAPNRRVTITLMREAPPVPPDLRP